MVFILYPDFAPNRLPDLKVHIALKKIYGAISAPAGKNDSLLFEEDRAVSGPPHHYQKM